MTGDLVERYRRYCKAEAVEKGEKREPVMDPARLSQYLWLSRTSKLRKLTFEERERMEWVKHHWMV